MDGQDGQSVWQRLEAKGLPLPAVGEWEGFGLNTSDCHTKVSSYGLGSVVGRMMGASEIYGGTRG
jgi:hypothetical protein